MLLFWIREVLVLSLNNQQSPQSYNVFFLLVFISQIQPPNPCAVIRHPQQVGLTFCTGQCKSIHYQNRDLMGVTVSEFAK